MTFNCDDGDKLIELECYVNGQFFASYKVLPTFFLDKNMAGGQFTHCQASDCGNKYSEDAKFCRKCGVKRVYDPNQIEVDLVRDGYQGVGTLWIPQNPKTPRGRMYRVKLLLKQSVST